MFQELMPLLTQFWRFEIHRVGHSESGTMRL